MRGSRKCCQIAQREKFVWQVGGRRMGCLFFLFYYANLIIFNFPWGGVPSPPLDPHV